MGSNRIYCRQDWLYGRDISSHWVRQHETNAEIRNVVTSSEQERIRALEREVRELRKTNKILKLANAFFVQAELDRHSK